MLIVGGRNTGKTTLAKKLVAMANRPKLIVCDTVDHPHWQHLELVSDPSALARLKGGGIRIVGPQPEEIIAGLKGVVDAFIVFEDSQKFIEGAISKPVKAMLIDSKQVGNDLLFMYHGFDLVPPKFKHYLDLVIIKKTTVLPDKSMKDRFAQISLVIEAAQAALKSKNPYFHKTLDVSC